MRRLVLPLAFLFLAAPAQAAPPRGALTQLDGKAGCVANHLKVCTRAHGLDEVDGLAISPDGRFVYTAASYLGSDNAVATFRRTSSGALKPRGCISESGKAPCTKGRGLTGAIEITLSADGRSAYVASPYTGNDDERRGAIAVFARDPATGALTQAPDAAGCVSAGGIDGCAAGRAMAGLGGVAVSPDGASVYATSANGNAVLTFARDGATGALTQLAGGAGCIGAGGADGCVAGRGLDSAVSVLVSPDGRHVYTAASTMSQAVAEFARDPASGVLTQLGCISQAGIGGCDAGHGLGSAVQLAISPDGGNVYAAAFRTHSVAVLARDVTTGRLTQSAGPAGCVAAAGADGCARARGIAGAVAVTVSPDGRSVYVAGSDQGTVAAFGRGAGGRLKQLRGAARCTGDTSFCRAGDALGTAFDVLVSPDGRNVYVASPGDDAVAAFRRR